MARHAGTRAGTMGAVGGSGGFRDLRLYTPGWREDQPPELNETLPAGRPGRDVVALICSLLLFGAGLRLVAGPFASAPARLHAPIAAAAPDDAPLAPRALPPAPDEAPAPVARAAATQD